MVRRLERASFMAGAYVFPGGRVDQSDAIDPNAPWCEWPIGGGRDFPDLDRAESCRYRAAAIRELFEEAGVLLARDVAGQMVSFVDQGVQSRFEAARAALLRGEQTLRSILERDELRLALDALVPLAHWVTPAVERRRFDTRFFLAHMPDNQVPIHHDSESMHSVWITPADALERCRRDEITLPPPTWRTLKDLAGLATVGEALVWARQQPIMRRQPRFVRQHDVSMLLLPGDPLYPAPPGEAMVGETRFVLEGNRWRARTPPLDGTRL